MLLESILPTLPNPNLAWFITIAAVLGGVMLVYSQFVEAENRRDLIRMIGSLAMVPYAITIKSLVFALVMAGIFLASFIEFIEILLGYHKHTRQDVQIYE